ncbi:MAG TPA: hypothetical protein VF389_10055 [Woeseiaceae bacterium]
MSDPLAVIRRRLEKAELEHLRRHVADQASRIEFLERQVEQLTSECDSAWDASRHWHDQTTELTRELLAAGSAIGINVHGDMSLVWPKVE